MKKKLLALLLTVLTVCNLLIPTVSAQESAPASEPENVMATYYVSPDGDDGNDGQTAETPFATLERARDAVRAVNSDMTGDIVV